MAYKPSRADTDRAEETLLDAAEISAATSPLMLNMLGIAGYGCRPANMLPLGAPVGGPSGCRRGMGKNRSGTSAAVLAARARGRR